MVNDYPKQRFFINERAEPFLNFLREEVLGHDAVRLLERVASKTDVYIFSGIIRNYLLGFTENRDVDVVVKRIDNLRIDDEDLRMCRIARNAFGGYKIKIDNLTIDAWGIENTWGVLENRLNPTPNSLIKTAFFNFSSIVYHYNKRMFIYDDEVCRFLQNRTMDVVYKQNPDKTLCVLNSIYYARKYKFPLGYSLCKWIARNYYDEMPFVEVQKRHFHKQIISEDSVNWFTNSIAEIMKIGGMRKGQALYFDFVQKQICLINTDE